MEIVWWRMDPESQRLFPGRPRSSCWTTATALVALPHVSNLLGEIVDLQAVTALAHAVGARVVADGVAYAPHRAIDVQAWDVDWYVYSTYKVYGPHMAVMYGKPDALAELTGPNHFFIPDDDLPYKFEPGGANHEGCAGLLGLGDYLKFLAGTARRPRPATAPWSRRPSPGWRPGRIRSSTRLLDYLNGRPDVRVIGPARRRTRPRRHRQLRAREQIVAGDHRGRGPDRGRHPPRPHVRLAPVRRAGPGPGRTAWCGSASSTTTRRRRSTA